MRPPRLAIHPHARAMLAAASIALLAATVACRDPTFVDGPERRAIADTLTALVRDAHDFSSPGAPARLLSLYPDSGRVISAAAGRVTATRPALAAEIEGFWQRVGQNMGQPTFELGTSYADVLTRDAVVLTFTYRIPHTTPAGLPHTVSGAWTMLWRRVDGRWRIVQEHLSDTPESTAPGATPADTAPTDAMPTDTTATAHLHR